MLWPHANAYGVGERAPQGSPRAAPVPSERYRLDDVARYAPSEGNGIDAADDPRHGNRFLASRRLSDRSPCARTGDGGGSPSPSAESDGPSRLSAVRSLRRTVRRGERPDGRPVRTGRRAGAGRTPSSRTGCPRNHRASFGNGPALGSRRSAKPARPSTTARVTPFETQSEPSAGTRSFDHVSPAQFANRAALPGRNDKARPKDRALPP